MVNGTKTYEIIMNFSADIIYYKRVYFFHEDKIIAMVHVSMPAPPKLITIFNQILSTFKFIER